MSNPYQAPADVYRTPSEVKVTIGAGTAIKFGFFAAFGMVLFSLIVSVLLFALGLVFAMIFGGAPFFAQLF